MNVLVTSFKERKFHEFCKYYHFDCQIDVQYLSHGVGLVRVLIKDVK